MYVSTFHWSEIKVASKFVSSCEERGCSVDLGSESRAISGVLASSMETIMTIGLVDR